MQLYEEEKKGALYFWRGVEHWGDGLQIESIDDDDLN
jgi:hypothetical protein